MSEIESNSLLSFYQKVFLLFAVLILMTTVFLYRGGFSKEFQLEQLARRSLEPNKALINGRPTVVEFYADWCEVCKTMAPTIIQLEDKYQSNLDIVMLNIENPLWEGFVDKYQVNGIPQFDFFNASGDHKGMTVGFKEAKELEFILDSLI